MSAPVISVRDLGLAFPGKKGAAPIEVLRAINLDVMPGEFVCLVGPSGCGKTTLLNIITGFLKQSTGEVLVKGFLSKVQIRDGFLFFRITAFFHGLPSNRI